jgi:hypothetical protein
MPRWEKISLAILALLVFFLFFQIVSLRIGGVHELSSLGEAMKFTGPEFIPVLTRKQGILSISPNNPHVLTYTSASLGLRFSYLENPEKFTSPEENDQALLFANQPVTRFEKDPEDTLEAAIKRTLDLESFPLCTILGTTGRTALQQFKTAELRTPSFTKDVDTRCPSNYYSQDEVKIFFYDTTHPDRFYFINIGTKVTALAPNGKDGWYKTLEITSN